MTSVVLTVFYPKPKMPKPKLKISTIDAWKSFQGWIQNHALPPDSSDMAVWSCASVLVSSANTVSTPFIKGNIPSTYKQVLIHRSACHSVVFVLYINADDAWKEMLSVNQSWLATGQANQAYVSAIPHPCLLSLSWLCTDIKQKTAHSPSKQSGNKGKTGLLFHATLQ